MTDLLQSKAERWIRAPVHSFDLGPEHCLLRFLETGDELVLNRGAMQVLGQCDVFASLEEHATRLAAATRGDRNSVSRIQGLLEQLAERGALLPESRLRAGLLGSSTVPDQAQPAKPVVVIRTCDRPAALARLLSGLAPYCDAGDVERVLVVDDSRDASARTENRQSLERLRRAGVSTYYHGHDAQQALARRCAGLVEGAESAASWLLVPDADGSVPTPGRALNHALLLTAGERIILLDDDVVVTPKEGSPHIDAAPVVGNVPLEAGFYRGFESVQDSTRVADLSPFAVHAACLGRTLATFLQSSTVRDDTFANPWLHSRDVADLHADVPILVSVNGVFGDPGTQQAHWLYDLGEGHGYRQLVASEDDYRYFTTHRTVWRGHHRTALLPDHDLMLTAGVGVDNRRFMPPTAPRGRNEDLLFGNIVKYLYPASMTVSLPWGLVHQPETERRWDPADLDRPHRAGPLALLASLSRACAPLCPARSELQRLAFLAESCRSIADASPGRFRDHVMQQILTSRSRLVQRLQAHLAERTSAPRYWSEDIRRIIAANTRPPDHSIENWAMTIGFGSNKDSSADAEERLRSLYRDYSCALDVWPQFWESCRDIGLDRLVASVTNVDD
jgi:hypothetical protein